MKAKTKVKSQDTEPVVKRPIKAMVDLKALRRELQQRIKVLRSDTIYFSSTSGQVRVGALAKRVEVVEYMIENYDLFDWFFNPDSEIKRAFLIDQDKIELNN